MDNKQTLYVMVGLPGSGKTKAAYDLLNNGLCDVVISSDALRKELLGDENDQTNNQLVFEEYYNRMVKALINGKTVVVDATNITKKARRGVFDKLEKLKLKNLDVCAYVINTPLEVVYEQNKKRERVVPEEVIQKFLLSYQHPQFFEGFTHIKFLYPQTQQDLSLVATTQSQMDRFDQNNRHHLLTLGGHCEKVADNYIDNLNNNNHRYLYYAALWHDIGKLYTRSTDENGQSHYYSHAQYGAYVVASHLDLLPQMSIEEIQKVLFYINWHMQAHEWEKQGDSKKYIKLFGEELYSSLMQFAYYDGLAKS